MSILILVICLALMLATWALSKGGADARSYYDRLYEEQNPPQKPEAKQDPTAK